MKPTYTYCCGDACDALLPRHGRTRESIPEGLCVGLKIGGWREAPKAGRCRVCAELTVRQVETWPVPAAS